MALTYHRSQDKLETKYLTVSSQFSHAERILEVGCHTGYFSLTLAKMGHSVVGLELDAEAASVATRNGIEVIIADIENPEVIESIRGKFDSILLMDVIEHLRDPATALRRLHAIISSGRLLCTVPNVAYWAVRKNLLFGKWDYADGGILDRTHLHFYTAKTMRRLFEDAGYRVTKLAPADAMLPWEHIIGRLPGMASLLPSIRDFFVKALPNLLTIDFLIEAVPAEKPKLIP